MCYNFVKCSWHKYTVYYGVSFRYARTKLRLKFSYLFTNSPNLPLNIHLSIQCLVEIVSEIQFPILSFRSAPVHSRVHSGMVGHPLPIIPALDSLSEVVHNYTNVEFALEAAQGRGGGARIGGTSKPLARYVSLTELEKKHL